MAHMFQSVTQQTNNRLVLYNVSPLLPEPELNQAREANPEQLKIDEATVDIALVTPIDETVVVDALLGRPLKDSGSPHDVNSNNADKADLVAEEPHKTRQVKDTFSGNDITTANSNKNSEEVDLYKAGEVEDRAEAASLKKAGICPNDCFAADCVIL